MQQILIATNNIGKFHEISLLFANLPDNSLWQPIFAGNYNIAEPEENGISFEENAIIKAKYYANHTNLVSLSDDSGISIPALNNFPSINSARVAIDQNGNKDFFFAFKKIEKMLLEANINPQKSRVDAFFTCNLTLFNPKNNSIHSFEGRVDGFLQFPPKGDNGFGYDPIFIANLHNQTFGEMNQWEKDKISHRALAFQKLQDFLKIHSFL